MHVYNYYVYGRPSVAAAQRVSVAVGARGRSMSCMSHLASGGPLFNEHRSILLAVVGNKFDLDIGTASRKLSNPNACPRRLGIRHQLLVHLFCQRSHFVLEWKSSGATHYEPERMTYFVHGGEILGEIREVDVCLDDVLERHISPLEHSFEILDNLSRSVLNLGG